MPFIKKNKNDDESVILDNDTKTTTNVVINMDDASSVNGIDIPSHYVIGYRPTLSYCVPLNASAKSAYQRSAGANRRVCLIVIVLAIIVVAVLILVHTIST